MEISLHTNPTVLAAVQQENKRRTISCRVKNNNFYEVLSLGAKKNAGFDEIKKAYRSMALRYHPDVSPPSLKEECTRRFLELQRAYDTLADPVSREQYDYELGLVDPWPIRIGCERKIGEGYQSCRFSSEVWEKQLSQLRQRSLLRMHKKRQDGLIK